jgi:dipeptide/tripeptide permease
VVSYIMRKVRPFTAMTMGTLVASLSWLLLMPGKATWLFVAAMVVLAIGEITQSPRFYEYVSRLAPEGQQGTYMGFAFLPIAIGYAVAGGIGGRLVHYYGEVLHRPERMWWIITAIGIATTLLMWFYDKIVKPGATEEAH